MVRVASLKDMVHANYKKKDIAGMSASEQLEKINERTRELVTLQYNTYNRSLVPLMHQHGIVVIDAFEDLSESQAAFVDILKTMYIRYSPRWQWMPQDRFR